MEGGPSEVEDEVCHSEVYTAKCIHTGRCRGGSQEHLSRKCADLFSEPQLGRKCGRNASSLNLARLTCRSSRTAATLPTGGGKKRSRDCDVDGEEGKKETDPGKKQRLYGSPLPCNGSIPPAPRLACHEISAGSPWSVITGPTLPRGTHVFFQTLLLG
jgi:hypothetical protein